MEVTVISQGWFGDMPICISHNRLFHLERERNALVANRCVNGSFVCNWSRIDIGSQNTYVVQGLCEQMSNITLGVHPDCWRWTLNGDGWFYVAFARNYIDRNLLPSSEFITEWRNFLSGKVNIFIWRFIRDKVPNKLNLSRQGLKFQSISCVMCNQGIDSSEHLFFHCSYAHDVWRTIFIWIDRPMHGFSSWQEVLSWIDAVDSIEFFSFAWLRFRARISLNWNQWRSHTHNTSGTGHQSFSPSSVNF
ncbi:uncharacterized protein [Rutidosis leptorrhynchoides]|uniref:uncharacterized protein n=1 Tax=Rutidosis leptorrhynchoides TaxID=125765 RepID=UPI003A98E635